MNVRRWLEVLREDPGAAGAMCGWCQERGVEVAVVSLPKGVWLACGRVLAASLPGLRGVRLTDGWAGKEREEQLLWTCWDHSHEEKYERLVIPREIGAYVLPGRGRTERCDMGVYWQCMGVYWEWETLEEADRCLSEACLAWARARS